MNASAHHDKHPAPIRLGRIIFRHKGMILAGIGLSLLSACFSLWIPFISRYIIDALTEGGLRAHHLALWLLLYLLAALAGGAASFWMRKFPLSVGHRVETAVRAAVFEHLTRLDRNYYRSQHTGDLLNRMSSDLRTIALAVGQGFMQISRLVLVFVLAYAIMFRICVPLAAAMLLMTPLMALSFSFVAKRVKRAHLWVQEDLSNMANFSQETFSGIQAVKAFAAEPRWRELFAAINASLLGKNLALARIHEAIAPLATTWFAAGSAIILILGGTYVIRGRITLGQLVQFNQYLLYMQWPLLSLGWIVGLQQRGRASWQRIAEILNTRPAIEDEPPRALATPGLSLSNALSGGLVFDHVSVSAGAALVLDQIDLTIPAGSRLGITGPTGSGKTTLVSLIPRLLDPTAGEIRLGGNPLRAFPLAELRAAIGMAEQETTLFSDTIAHNLAFGLDRYTPEQLFAVADIAHLHGDIEQFPNQYETLVGERGVTLSGGQRQRASIARALAREPRILILDDVLASVDTATEAAILEKLRPIFAGRTVILVSHRVSALRDMDCVIVLENGRISQQGPPTDLARRPGYYRNLCDIQELAAELA